MKVSELWLREWVNPELNVQQLAAQLTMAGLEVDSIAPVAGIFSNVIVAEVSETHAHPQADKLTVCMVNMGGEKLLQIVCGASNVRPGLKVALALPGADLPNDIHIKETTLRGQLSQGMLCSVSELGLSDASEGIMELDAEAPIGKSLREYLQLEDHVIDIDLTPNRADCFSIAGVAREVAVLNHLPLNRVPAVTVKPAIDDVLKINLQNAAACPQYCGRVIREINPQATTPLWLRERLRRAGLRPLHPVVDVTNYVMLELGQPLHAFDLHEITGGITIRYAQPEETLVLLDGMRVNLDTNVLVIADQTKALAIAGVIGGEASAVTMQTTDIFLESAFFTPAMISGVARRYSLCTDASQRFERGVDPALQKLAIERATVLLQSIAGGQAGPISTVTQETYLPPKVTIAFHPSKVEQLCGISIPEKDMLSMLEGLDFSVEKHVDHWTVGIPSHRFDMHQEVDIVEEVIRLYGYDRLVASPLTAEVSAGTESPIEACIAQANAFFISRGYRETINYSFVDPSLQDLIQPNREKLSLLNPISPELAQMRTSLWPGLLAAMIYNVYRQQTSLKLFETGTVFQKQGHEVQEIPHLAGLLVGEHSALNWSEPTRKFDFYDLKGDLQSFFNQVDMHRVSFVKEEHPALHPGQSAKIMIDNVAAGWLGVLHPRLTDALDIPFDAILFELSIDAVQNRASVRYKQISKYPQIRRDLALLVDQEITAAQIEQAVWEIELNNRLKTFYVFDVYTGEPIPSGKKSLAIALVLQDDHRTLVDAEINTIISAIIKKLDDEFSIILRD